MDIQILLWFQSLRAPLLDAINFGITLLGEDAVLLVLICVMYWCLHKKNALFIIFNFFAGVFVNNALKITFCTPRPWLRDARIRPYEKALGTATGYSFPSGHVACAASVYGGLALLSWRKRKWLSWALIALTLLIGVSRMYVGVHTPQDVLVSLALGALLIFAVRAAQRWLERRPERDVWALAGILAASLALLLYTYGKPYPAGSDRALLDDAYKTAGSLAGMGCGWFVERRWIRFDVRAPGWFQAVKAVVGLLGIIAARLLLKPVCLALVGEEFAGALRYFLLVLWAVCLWPLAFSRLQRKLR